MTVTRQILNVFAQDGDYEEVPMDSQPDDTVSYADGYTYDYQRPVRSSPLAKEIGRLGFNGLLRDFSAILKQYQEDGAPQWFEDTPYAEGSRVKHLDAFWVNTVEGSEGEPGVSTDWENITIPARARKNNLVATTDPTADDDNTEGYEPLSTWINTSSNEVFMCISAATGAADWQPGTLSPDELGSAAFLNASSIGSALIQVATPVGPVFLRLNSDGSISSLTASQFVTAIGLAEMDITAVQGTLVQRETGTGDIYARYLRSNGAAVNSGTVAYFYVSISGNDELMVRRGLADIRSDLGLGTMASQNATSVNIDGGAIDGTVIGGSSTAAANVTSLGVSGDITINGTARRIIGDFSSATVSNRVYFKTSTANGNTIIGVIPDGTGRTGRLQLHNTSDPANSSRMFINSTLAVANITSDAVGTGTILPMQFIMGSTVAQEISTSADTGFGVSPDTSCKLQTSNGIKLGNSSNSNANVFDFYEEGNALPTVSGTSTAGAATYTIQVGEYTRKGDEVEGYMVVGWSAHTGTGNIQIGGFPYTSKSTVNLKFAFVGSFDGLNVGSGKTLGIEMANSSTTALLYANDPAGGAQAQVAMDTSVTKLVIFYSYKVPT